MESSEIILLLVISPPIISIIAYYMNKLFFKHKRRAFHFTISWTTIFYIIAVIVLIDYIFSFNLTGIMSVILLVILSIILIIQWKTRTEVILSNGLKLLWRFSFLIFIPIYIGLMMYTAFLHFTS